MESYSRINFNNLKGLLITTIAAFQRRKMARTDQADIEMKNLLDTLMDKHDANGKLIFRGRITEDFIEINKQYMKIQIVTAQKAIEEAQKGLSEIN